MANKHIKMHHVKKMQIKNTLRYFIPIRMAWKTRVSSADKDKELLDFSYIAGREFKMVSPFYLYF